MQYFTKFNNGSPPPSVQTNWLALFAVLIRLSAYSQSFHNLLDSPLTSALTGLVVNLVARATQSH